MPNPESPSPGKPPLLCVENLRVSFRTEGPPVEAVRGVSFDIAEGETVALVGESGSGKSATALALARLLPSPPAVYAGGRVLFEGVDTLAMPSADLRRLRGKGLAYIFQEPGTSLNPVFRIRTQIREVLDLHRPDVGDPAGEVARLLETVGIRDAAQRMRDYPHQLSGGMQQRVMIAMALAGRPRLLVADEPTTALDVTIQKQVMDLLKDLKSRLGMAVLLITHNFGIVSGFADRVLVMFRGKIVEQGPTANVLSAPSHPYTRALIDCIPRLGARRRRLPSIDYSTLGEAA